MVERNGPMICPACGASDWRARDVLPQLIVRTCTTCGLRTSAVDAAPSYGYAEIDRATYTDALGSLRRAQALDVLEWTRARAQSGVWLDVGCGPGYLLAAAAEAGFAIRGVEPDPTAAALARERLGNEVITEGTFPTTNDQRADVISTLDVIEHIPIDDLPSFASAVRTTLETGGIWTIKIPSSEGLYFRIANALRLQRPIARLWQVGYQSPHTVYFSLASLARFLARNGFEVIAHRYVQELPLRSAIPRLTLDGRTPRWQARLALPAIAAINIVEALRGKSDALLLLARARRA